MTDAQQPEYIITCEYIEKLDEWLGEHGIDELQRMQIRTRLKLTPSVEEESHCDKCDHWDMCEGCPYTDERSRPSPSHLTIDPKDCFEEIVYSSTPWKIYRQDAGMGEHDYAVFLNDVFFCRTDDSQTAMRIVNTMRAGGEQQ